MKTDISVIYIGGPTVIIEVGGLRIMTDPTLDPAGTSFTINDKPAYAKTDNPAITDIGRIDVVLLSHDQHGDNLDNAGRELLKTVPLTLTTVIGAGRLKGSARGLNSWELFEISSPQGGVIQITSTPARHGPSGFEKISGDVTGFIVEYKGRQLYFTGDTVFYDGIKQVAAKFNPEYVFIFAGAAKPRGPFNVTMGTNDAIDTAFVFPNATIVPVHFEGWTHYTEHGDALRQSFTAVGMDKQLMIPQLGAKFVL